MRERAAFLCRSQAVISRRSRLGSSILEILLVGTFLALVVKVFGPRFALAMFFIVPVLGLVVIAAPWKSEKAVVVAEDWYTKYPEVFPCSLPLAQSSEFYATVQECVQKGGKVRKSK